jgi:GGDEF domain-containing protein
MSAGVFSHDSQHFALELDEAAQSHMAWTRRVLRCAVLRSAPDDDIAATDAHLRCPFELWFRRHRQRFDELDADAARRLDERHRQMHDAARRICRRIAAGRPGDVGELDAFERAQAGVVADLALLKTAHLARSARLDALTGLPLRHGLDEERERLRAQARRDSPLVLPDGRTLAVRDSAGMAEVGDTEPVTDTLARADRALYAAKAAGRDSWRWAVAERAADFRP